MGAQVVDLLRRKRASCGRPDPLSSRKETTTVEPNVVYENDGKGAFKPVAEPLFNYKSLSHDIVLEDLDHDGRIEIYTGVDAAPSYRVEVLFPATNARAVVEQVKPGQRIVVQEP